MLQRLASELLAPVLQDRIAEREQWKSYGENTKNQGRRKYEDGPQWLLDAYTAHGKTLSATQLARDLFSILDSSMFSTAHSAISILLDLLEHPDSVDEIRAEIQRVKETLSGEPWSRAALGELRILDSFMRESARVHGLNDCMLISLLHHQEKCFSLTDSYLPQTPRLNVYQPRHGHSKTASRYQPAPPLPFRAFITTSTLL